MNEIKARSYSESDKCFYYFFNGGYFRENGEIAHKWRFNWENAEKYTPLKCKNSDGLYSGDIVKIKRLDYEEKHILKNNSFYFYFYPGMEYLDIDDIRFDELIVIKKIGNIHENNFEEI